MNKLIRRAERAGKPPHGSLNIRSGNTVRIVSWAGEGTKKRRQSFEGTVIGVKHCGANSSITVRRVSHGVGVEKIVLLRSPMLEKISIEHRGVARKAKLYFLRNRWGRSARIKTRIPSDRADPHS